MPRPSSKAPVPEACRQAQAAGTAAGFVGLFGYFIGDAICSKIFVGSVANHLGWNAANLTVAIGAGIGVLLCAMLIKSEKSMTNN